jgi:hypothetical protein
MGWAAVAIFFAIILQIAGATAGVLWIRREIQREKQEIAEKIRVFVTAPEGSKAGTLSPLAELVEVIAHRFSYQLVQQARSQLTGHAGAVIAQEKALQQDMFVDAASAQSPLLGMIASAFPSVTKRVLKNPSALPALMNLLGSMNPGSAQSQGSSSNGGSVADRIKHQT